MGERSQGGWGEMLPTKSPPLPAAVWAWGWLLRILRSGQGCARREKLPLLHTSAPAAAALEQLFPHHLERAPKPTWAPQNLESAGRGVWVRKATLGEREAFPLLQNAAAQGQDAHLANSTGRLRGPLGAAPGRARPGKAAWVPCLIACGKPLEARRSSSLVTDQAEVIFPKDK